MNGGAAISAVARRFGAEKWWPAGATVALQWLSIAICASWLLALLMLGAGMR
ncbi:MAG: hypothetical protein HYX47_18020 [Burkholderiales bacterium]|nr:hypothetical protein [Burkholderiales bacterium]